MSGRDKATNQMRDHQKKNKASYTLSDFLCDYRFQEVVPLTTGHGAPVGDKLNSVTIGPRGPLLIQDHVFLEEMAHFDRERIPERVVHAKGAGAFGYFEVTHDITKYTKAAIFSKVRNKYMSYFQPTAL